MSYYVYIITNKRRGTLYTGMTNNIMRRGFEHKEKLVPGFTKRYNLDRIVHSEEFANVSDAIKREKQVKNWHRDWKVNLIEENNPDWDDLAAFAEDPETSSG